MSELRMLQQSFWARLTAGEADDVADDGRYAWLEGKVRGDSRTSAQERLALYASMYFCRLRDNLAADFPRLASVLGQHAFDRLVARYLDAHPSRHPSVRHVGRALPQFIRGQGGEGARPWLADLAALEWARLDVFDRADQAVLSHAQLRAAAERGLAELHLELITAHARVEVGHDVTGLWRDAAEARAEPPRTKLTLLVWRRPDDVVHHRALAADEAEYLVALRDGLDFSALCARLCAGRSDRAAALRAIELVSAWTAAGLLRATSAGHWE